MGNNGNGRDTRLLEKMIQNSKLLTIKEDPLSIIGQIKSKLNDVVEKDKIIYISPFGKKYSSHTGYGRMLNTLTTINKLRQQNWFWDEIEYE